MSGRKETTSATARPPVVKRVRGANIEMDKRTYLPFKVASCCPQCGKRVTLDLRDDYLSYPITGKPYALSFTHEVPLRSGEFVDDHEWEVSVVLNVTLEVKT